MSRDRINHVLRKDIMVNVRLDEVTDSYLSDLMEIFGMTNRSEFIRALIKEKFRDEMGYT